MLRVATSGVLLGIAGAAFLELAKTILEVSQLGAPPVQAGANAVVVFAVLFVISLALAGLALRASALSFVLYAGPIGLLGLVITSAVFLVPAFLGFIPSSTADLKLLGRVLALVGSALLLLFTCVLLRDVLDPVAKWIWTRSASVRAMLVRNRLPTLGVVGAVLLGVGVLLAR